MRYRIILAAVAMALGLADMALAVCPYSTVWPSCTIQYPGGDNLEDERDVHRDYAFASLPSCITGGNKFLIAFVNDASEAGACDGGGSAMSLCGCDGSAWVALGGGGDTDTGPIPDCTSTELQGADGTCITDLAELNTALGTGLVTGAHVATGITDEIIVEADLDDNSQTPTDGDFLAYASAGSDFIWITGDLLGSDLTSTTDDLDTTNVADQIRFCRDAGTECVTFDLTSNNRLTIQSATGLATISFNNMTLFKIGALSFDRDVSVQAGSVCAKTIGTSERSFRWFFSPSTCATGLTYTISGSIVQGNSFCLTDLNSASGTILDPESNDKIWFTDGAGSAHVLMDAGESVRTTDGTPAVGDTACFTAVDAEELFMFNVTGSWQQETP